MDLPNEAPEEMEAAHGHVRKRLECSSSTIMKRPRTCLAESGQIMTAGTIRRGTAAGSCSSVEKYDGHDEEDPNSPRLVTSSTALIISPDRDQEVDPAEADVYLPPGWARTKLEPDW